jgi:hypothetical protein
VAVAESPAPIRFRPLPLPELLDELFRLYRRHFGLIVAISLIVVLPTLIWTLVTGLYKFTFTSYGNLLSNGGTTNPTLSSTELGRLGGLLFLGGLGSLLFLPFSLGAVYRAVADVAQGRAATVGGVLRETLGRYLPLFGLIGVWIGLLAAWAILTFLVIVVSAQRAGFLIVLWILVSFVALIYCAIRWSLTVAAMMAEDTGPIRGMRRSWDLVGGSWWRTVGILLILTIMQSIIGGALGVFWNLIVSGLLSGDVGTAVGATGSTLLQAVVSPLAAIGVVLLYFDLRVRKEGLDLDQLARQTGPAPA